MGFFLWVGWWLGLGGGLWSGETIGIKFLILAQGTDQGMLFQEGQSGLSGRPGQQLSEFPQAPGTERQRLFTGLVELLGRKGLGQVQKKEYGFIGEILVKLGYLDERDIVVTLVVQCGLPYIAVNKYTVDPEVLRLIPKDMAQKERMIPLDRIGDILSVVMTNPLTDERKMKLEILTKCRIATFISTKSEIEEAIGRLY